MTILSRKVFGRRIVIDLGPLSRHPDPAFFDFTPYPRLINIAFAEFLTSTFDPEIFFLLFIPNPVSSDPDRLGVACG